MQPKCRGIPEEDTECKLVRMKMNLYPNQGVNVKHGVHNDILQNGAPRPDVVTSVFNFHTCNAETFMFNSISYIFVSFWFIAFTSILAFISGF